METVELAFYRGEGRLFDRLIRWWTKSQFSHCEIVLMREGENALLFSASARDGGVRTVWRKWADARWHVIKVPARMTPGALEAFMSAEMGAGYDFIGLFGSQFFARGWQSKKRWFCSEICAHVLGLPDPQRYSPESLRKIALFLNGKRFPL